MNKQPLTKEQIERLLIAELQTFPHCERALQILVIPVIDRDSTITWTVSRFKCGGSGGEACDRALQHIVPRFQRAYDMVCKH